MSVTPQKPLDTFNRPRAPQRGLASASSSKNSNPSTPERSQQPMRYARPDGPLKSALRLFSREFLNKHSNSVAVAAAVVIVICLVIALRSGFGGASHRVIDPFAWYYDINTGELFASENDLSNTVAIEAPSGKTADGAPAGYRAFVHACGSCEDASQRFVAYLMKPDADGTTLITTPKGNKWLPITSPEAETLIDSLPGRCVHGTRLSEPCAPTSK